MMSAGAIGVSALQTQNLLFNQMKRTLLIVSLALLGGIQTSQAATNPPSGPDSATPGGPAPDTATHTDWLSGDGITGDWSGLRNVLVDQGVEFFASYLTEGWGNTTGGLEQGTVYTGLLKFGLNLDLQKAIGWHGASMSTTWLWLSGRDASADLLGNFLTISNIAGFNTLRNFELWFQQNLLDDKISLRLGQLAADSEFVISDYGSTFINGTFGWPAFMYTNLPEGGPGYPMGTLGIRLAVHPLDWFTFQTAVFQGNVYAQNVNNHGFRWRLDSENGFFFLNEAQIRWHHRDNETGLPGQFKGGAWFHTAKFAEPDSNSFVRGNYGFYFILDQMLYREQAIVAENTDAEHQSGKSALSKSDGANVPPAEQKSEQGLGCFGRIAFEPQDRNFIGFYFDTGLTYKGLLPTRDDDTFGVAFAYAQLTSGAEDAAIAEGSVGVGSEMVLETTYQTQITKWLSIQPNVQFIFNPGGTQDLDNAIVVGGRVSISF
jgi:porin